jgi:predicted transcriptional regulator of viral defense system
MPHKRSSHGDHRIAELAGGQHGVVARRQLLALGLSAAEIRNRSDAGRLLRVHRGVYAVGHRLLSQEGRWMAAVLACGPGAVLSHWSAAQHLGIAPRRAMKPEVSRPTASRGRPGIVCHRSAVAADERDVVRGIPVTSLSRTLFDLAAVGTEREVERAFHEAEVRRLTDRVSVGHLMERYPRRQGAAALREVLAAKEPPGITQNDFEERFVAFIDRHGLPRPSLNGTLPLRGRLLRPDCMWPRERLIVELDGRKAHRTDRAFEGDRRRDRELLAEGWRSARVTWTQLRDESAEVAADLRRLLA